MRLLLIRHAESVGNAEARLQGQTDFPLSEYGVAQARRLAVRLAERERPTAVYTSPLKRTSQTASVVAAALGSETHPLPAVMEYDFGLVSGLSYQEIGERYPEVRAAMRQRTPEYPQYPGEEGREAFRKRVCDAIAGLVVPSQAGDTIAVVTHGGPIVVYCLNVLGLPYRRPAPFAVYNASITTIEFLGERPGVLVATNDICHLEGME